MSERTYRSAMVLLIVALTAVIVFVDIVAVGAALERRQHMACGPPSACRQAEFDSQPVSRGTDSLAQC